MKRAPHPSASRSIRKSSRVRRPAGQPADDVLYDPERLADLDLSMLDD